jgi:hypothetical protein
LTNKGKFGKNAKPIFLDYAKLLSKYNKNPFAKTTPKFLSRSLLTTGVPRGRGGGGMYHGKLQNPFAKTTAKL